MPKTPRLGILAFLYAMSRCNPEDGTFRPLPSFRRRGGALDKVAVILSAAAVVFALAYIGAVIM